MCGIVGFSSALPNLDKTSFLKKMVEVMRHRGPDDEGFFSDEHVALGFCRLSIIDLVTGNQPMPNEDKTIWLIFNGEIYNYMELQGNLSSRGHVFRTKSDAEVIVHAYEEYGLSMLEKLHGMFAFGIWDLKKQLLIIARDRLGIKPLYYSHKPGEWFAFASEIKALLETGWIQREVNLEALNCYMTFLWTPDPMTMFSGIYKLLPGHYLIYQNGEIRIKQYWDLKFENLNNHDEEWWIQKVSETLQGAVKSHLQSDVPLGALMSGGLDSSSIIAIMSQLLKEPISTYTIGFRKEDLKEDVLMDELKYARKIATLFKTDYTEIIVKPDTTSLLPKLVWHMDEPVADPAAITTYLICKAAKEKLTVMLSGMGGDEIFAGYPRHLAELYAENYRRIPEFLRTGILEELVHKMPIIGPLRMRAFIRNSKKFVKSASLPFTESYLGFGTYFNQEERQSFFSKDVMNVINSLNPYEKHLEYFKHIQDEHPINQMIYVDIKTFLPCLNLTYTDKMSMAASIEVRVPFLDDRFVELSGGVPQDLKLNGRVGKYILKKASSRLLPDEIIWRKKAGFGAPVGAWIKGDLKEMTLDLLSEKKIKERGYFNYSAVKKMIEVHYSGKEYNALQIWQLLTLEIWHRVFIDKGTI